MLKKFLSGWKPSDPATYRRTYERFGGSVCAHPSILSHLNERGAGTVRFYHKEVDGEIVGAYFADGKDVIAHPASNVPVIFENIILPMAPGHRTYLPAKSKRLSGRHQGQFMNFAYGAVNPRAVCLVKGDFSAKSNKKRRAELNKFLNDGGEVLDIEGFSDHDLGEIYAELFTRRWHGELRCQSPDDIARFIGAIRPMMFGHILLHKGRPCAYDLVYAADCPRWIYFDDHNGGMDPELNHFGLGSILLWLNVAAAKRRCTEQGKEMIFSLGSAASRWSYKKRWGDEHGLGRSLI